nr:MAG TPA: hypothetical protein [Caudoviricetes sp.]
MDRQQAALWAEARRSRCLPGQHRRIISQARQIYKVSGISVVSMIDCIHNLI